MAKGLAQKRLEGYPVEVDCKGLVVLFPEPLNQKAEAVMIGNGIRLQGYSSAQIAREDVGDACLVLTLNEKQKEMILEQFPESGAIPRDRVLKSNGYRFLSHKDYLLFYQYDKETNTVYVMAIFNGKRDYMRVMKKYL